MNDRLLYAGFAVAVVVLTLGATVIGPLAIVAAVGLVVAGWGVLDPLRALAVFLGIDVFVRTAEHFNPSGVVSTLDDVGALLVALAAVLQVVRNDRRVVFPIGSLAMLGFLALGVVSAIVNGVQASVWIPGAYLACKGWLVAFAAAQVDWRRVNLTRVLQVLLVPAAVVLVASAVNLVAPKPWSAVFSTTGTTMYRYGLPALIGPFQHPFDLAVIGAVIAAGALSWCLFVRATPIPIVMTAAGVLVVVLSWRRKELIGLAIVIVLLMVLRRGAGSKLLLLLATPLAVLGLGPVVVIGAQGLVNEYIVNGSDAARTVLTQDSFALAAQHFPIGVGFGRFASRTAAVLYSPIYNELGYSAVWGLQDVPGGSSFLTDTSWPAIIGETGVLGALCFAALILLALAAAFRELARSADPMLRWLVLTCLTVLVIVVVDSIAAPIFTSPPGFGLFFGAIGVISSLRRSEALPGQAHAPHWGTMEPVRSEVAAAG